MSRYVGQGQGSWHGDWYCYVPSIEDRLLARDIGEDANERATGRLDHSSDWSGKVEGSGKDNPTRHVIGFLGEVAALHPIGSGPDLESWSGRGAWRGRGDYGQVEVRTTSRWQLYGFARAGKKEAGLGGWRITRKDRGRVVVCVQDRGDDLAVMGWVRADTVARLEEPLGSILAIIEPADLRPLSVLYDRMKELAL